ncbi:nucleoside triphosphate hydrolase [Hoeflea sp.]|uniref:nucleoside triphosphate hydrolase n=1 Tax=Hoeflea sp. TaxID=1940281 RepID=UPI002AFF9618|nr:nucleoside triphosphate hydrolase [Hoeflea sp.]
MGGRYNAEIIADRAIAGAGEAQRFIIALAGPPGVGKSTLSEALAAELKGRGHGAAIVPMDGFHLDNAVLDSRGQRACKGAPFTFDADGYAELLRRLKATPYSEIAIPVFDRELDLARASARIIEPGHRFLIAEGNYLLLDQEPWSKMAALFDFRVLLKADHTVLRQRLIERWIVHGLNKSQAMDRAMSNDIPNAELVINGSSGADMEIFN